MTDVAASAGIARTSGRLRRTAVVGGLLTFALLAILLAALMANRALAPVLAAPAVSPVVLDRHGALLRAFTVDDGRWRLPVTLADVDPEFLQLLIAYEDQRFREHAGVDWRAVVRAGAEAVVAGRIVSGASTITMQTVRLATGERARNPVRKLVEMGRALDLERRLSKDEILTRYLHLAPYGGNVEGIRAASLAYFGREPARLTLAQSALLIALPQSPEARRPDRHPEQARAARSRVLAELAARGAITPADARDAEREPIPTVRRPVPRLAPHVARRMIASLPERAVHRTTLDRRAQKGLEQLAAERVGRIGPRVSAAILMADLDTGAVRASVGAARFLDDARAGHVDMTEALRSPGSTLKPFIYGLAIDHGLIARNTFLSDERVAFGSYQPENFDDEFRGTVTAEEALRQSLNVPAVTLLNAIGPAHLLARLEDGGARVVLPPDRKANLAIGLGGMGISLADLAGLYAGLARAGMPRRLTLGDAPEPAGRLFSRRAAQDVTAMLQGTRPPKNAPARAIAYKTGTSYGHRDAWAVGYDATHVIAVWVGRPDGSPVPELTGWTDAAPLLFDAFARVGATRLGGAPEAVPSALLPAPLKRFPPAHGRKVGKNPISIAFPPDGAVVNLATTDGTRAPLIARVVGRAADTWLLNGRPLPVKINRKSAAIDLAPGRHELTVVTADGLSARVSFVAE